MCIAFYFSTVTYNCFSLFNFRKIALYQHLHCVLDFLLCNCQNKLWQLVFFFYFLVCWAPISRYPTLLNVCFYYFGIYNTLFCSMTFATTWGSSPASFSHPVWIRIDSTFSNCFCTTWVINLDNMPYLG